MQDRYAGDVGDFVKLGLLRAISPGRRLGVAWYRFPDEGHNGDGRHIGYLDQRLDYEALDLKLFYHLKDVVSRERSIRSLLPVLDATASMDKRLDATGVPAKARREWRERWFSDVLEQLSGCNLVFADPDNGIIDDQDRRKGSPKFGKQMPLSEVRALASGRCAVIYHHNTRRTGGHDAEVDYWLGEIGLPGFAVRATRYSPRTFFVLNADEEIEARAKAFCAWWSGMKVRMHY